VVTLDARAALAGTRFADVRWSAELGSTNLVAVELAKLGAADGTVVGAEHQTAGRGRRGRTWASEPGSSLLVSVILRPAPPLVTLLAGLAAAEACETVAGVAATLKWPNDVMAPEGKLGGILSELVSGPGPAKHAAVVGLGLNVNWRSPLPAGAVALGAGVDRGDLLVAWLTAFDRADDVVGRYRARCATIGRQVRVELADESIEGMAERIDEDGALVVDGRRIIAGDLVHLR